MVYDPATDPELAAKGKTLALLTHGAQCKDVTSRGCGLRQCKKAQEMLRHVVTCKAGAGCPQAYCADAKFVMMNGQRIQAALEEKKKLKEAKREELGLGVKSLCHMINHSLSRPPLSIKKRARLKPKIPPSLKESKYEDYSEEPSTHSSDEDDTSSSEESSSSYSSSEEDTSDSDDEENVMKRILAQRRPSGGKTPAKTKINNAPKVKPTKNVFSDEEESEEESSSSEEENDEEEESSSDEEEEEKRTKKRPDTLKTISTKVPKSSKRTSNGLKEKSPADSSPERAGVTSVKSASPKVRAKNAGSKSGETSNVYDSCSTQSKGTAASKTLTTQSSPRATLPTKSTSPKSAAAPVKSAKEATTKSTKSSGTNGKPKAASPRSPSGKAQLKSVGKRVASGKSPAPDVQKKTNDDNKQNKKRPPSSSKAPTVAKGDKARPSKRTSTGSSSAAKPKSKTSTNVEKTASKTSNAKSTHSANGKKISLSNVGTKSPRRTNGDKSGKSKTASVAQASNMKRQRTAAPKDDKSVLDDQHFRDYCLVCYKVRFNEPPPNEWLPIVKIIQSEVGGQIETIVSVFDSARKGEITLSPSNQTTAVPQSTTDSTKTPVAPVADGESASEPPQHADDQLDTQSALCDCMELDEAAALLPPDFSTDDPLEMELAPLPTWERIALNDEQVRITPRGAEKEANVTEPELTVSSETADKASEPQPDKDKKPSSWWNEDDSGSDDGSSSDDSSGEGKQKFSDGNNEITSDEKKEIAMKGPSDATLAPSSPENIVNEALRQKRSTSGSESDFTCEEEIIEEESIEEEMVEESPAKVQKALVSAASSTSKDSASSKSLEGWGIFDSDSDDDSSSGDEKPAAKPSLGAPDPQPPLPEDSDNINEQDANNSSVKDVATAQNRTEILEWKRSELTSADEMQHITASPPKGQSLPVASVEAEAESRGFGWMHDDSSISGSSDDSSDFDSIDDDERAATKTEPATTSPIAALCGADKIQNISKSKGSGSEVKPTFAVESMGTTSRPHFLKSSWEKNSPAGGAIVKKKEIIMTESVEPASRPDFLKPSWEKKSTDTNSGSTDNSNAKETGGSDSRPDFLKPSWEKKSADGGSASNGKAKETGGVDSRPDFLKPSWEKKNTDGGSANNDKVKETGGEDSRPNFLKPSWEKKSADGGTSSNDKAKETAATDSRPSFLKPSWETKSTDGALVNNDTIKETAIADSRPSFLKPSWENKSNDGGTVNNCTTKNSGGADSRPSFLKPSWEKEKNADDGSVAENSYETERPAFLKPSWERKNTDVGGAAKSNNEKERPAFLKPSWKKKNTDVGVGAVANCSVTEAAKSDSRPSFLTSSWEKKSPGANKADAKSEAKPSLDDIEAQIQASLIAPSDGEDWWNAKANPDEWWAVDSDRLEQLIMAVMDSW